MFNHFQGKTDGYDPDFGTHWYNSSALLCGNLSVESFSIIMNGYGGIWYDFVSFRIDLFETQLKSLYLKN